MIETRNITIAACEQERRTQAQEQGIIKGPIDFAIKYIPNPQQILVELDAFEQGFEAREDSSITQDENLLAPNASLRYMRSLVHAND